MPDNNTTENVDVEALRAELADLRSFKDEFEPIGQHLAANSGLLKAVVEDGLDDKRYNELVEAAKVKETPAPSAAATSDTVKAETPDLTELVKKLVAEAVVPVKTEVDERFEKEHELKQILETDLGQYSDQAAALYDKYPELDKIPTIEVFRLAKVQKMEEEAVVKAEQDRLEAERKAAESAKGGEGQQSATSQTPNPFGPRRKFTGF